MRQLTPRAGRRGLGGALLLLLPLLLYACATPVEPVATPPGLPSRAEVPGVPLIKQKDFYCGPAALAMTMQWGGLEVTQTQIAAQSFTPGAKGTYLADMLGAARRNGRLVVPVTGLSGVMAEVAAGNPVIVFENLGIKIAPRWHYAVVTGYDTAADKVMLNSGQYERMVVPFRLFQRTWKRGDYWAIAVLPPDRLPARADPWEIVRAAAALERVKQYPAAAHTYAAAEKRWPKMWVFPFGLGNARYAMGDLKGAKAAWLRAQAIDPSVKEVRQNLAELAKKTG